MKITSRNIASLQLPKGKADHVYFDEAVTGLGLRLREGGSRTWVFRYRVGARQRSYALGKANEVPLAVARENARKLVAKVTMGADPALEKQVARLESENTFAALAHQYLEAKKPDWRPRSYSQIAPHFNKYAKSLHSTPIAAVSQRQIANLLRSITETSGRITANRVRASLAALFSWCLKEGIKLPDGNVAANTHKHEEKSRERVLTDAELKTLWRALPDDDFGAAIKLLILTGQREKEIGSLRWEEVHDEQIVLPSSRTKNKRTHVIPLSDASKAILDKFKSNYRTFVFGRDDTGFQGWGNAKRRLDENIKLAPWTIHDLRRSAVTHMAELGVQPHIIEAVINHASGHKGGVAGIYNRSTYDKEKREALNLWATHLRAVVGGVS